MFTHRPWEDFAELHDPHKPSIPAQDLVELQTHRRPERIAACAGEDPLLVLAAYAQDLLVYTPQNKLIEVDTETYAATDIHSKLNKFARAYRADAPLLLHKTLADITIDAAIHLKQNHHWQLRVYDGFRSMEAAYILYRHALPQWLGFDEAGNKTLPALLSEPGTSAHNRALAVDSSLVDEAGCEIERFDNADMHISHRNYTGDKITPAQRNARLAKERAFQRAALKHNTLLAPLRSEYWDDRPPGTEADLWRVMESLCRCLCMKFFTEKATDYLTFTQQWKQLDARAFHTIFGFAMPDPPTYESVLFHEKLNILYDKELPGPLRLTD